jgi:hypothetical protein
MIVTMDINWERVRRIMEKSIYGGQLTDEESDYIKTVWVSAPDEYKKLHGEIRDAVHEEMRKWWRCRL